MVDEGWLGTGPHERQPGAEPDPLQMSLAACRDRHLAYEKQAGAKATDRLKAHHRYIAQLRKMSSALSGYTDEEFKRLKDAVTLLGYLIEIAEEDKKGDQ